MTKRVDPTNPRTVGWQHVQLSLYLVKDRVLDRWNERVEPDCDLGLKGNACDDMLLKLAQKHRAPMITNEGYSTTGVSNKDPRGLRARAIDAGVAVYTPRQFWAGKMGEGSACRKFLARYDAAVPRFLQSQGRSDGALNAVRFRRGVMDHVFYGHTADGRTLPVRLPSSV